MPLSIKGSGGSGGGASFTTIQTPSGTSPVATGPSDALTLTSSDSSVAIVGNSTTDTVNLKNAGIIETSSYASPAVISGAISVPTALNARLYLKGSSALTTVTSIGNGVAGQSLLLYGCDDAFRIKLTNLSNLKLNGEWQSAIDAEICLHRIDGANKWVEAYRNGV